MKVAQAFHSRVPLTGLVLSKFDADTRGGAALSFQRVTKVPIRFLGTGEGIDALELFQPDRLVGRLLGMGDIVGLVEKAQAEFDAASTRENGGQKLAKNSFDLQDFLDQIKMVKKLGPLQNVLGMIPGMPKIPDSVDGEKSLRRVEAMIRSMTPEETVSPVRPERPSAAAHCARQRHQRDGTQRTFASVRRDEEDDAAAHPRRKPGQDAAQFNGQALDKQKEQLLWQ